MPRIRGNRAVLSGASEHLEQVGYVAWFRRTYPDVLIYAIPNGGGRSAAQGARLKAEGVVRGIPDLHIPAWGLWVEMKRAKGGKLSDHQKKTIEYLYSIGHCVIIGLGTSDAIKQTLEWRLKNDH